MKKKEENVFIHGGFKILNDDGNLLEALDMFKKGIECYKKQIEEMFEKGDREKYYEKLLEAAYANVSIAYIHRELQEEATSRIYYKEAKGYYERCIKNNPNRPEAYGGKGTVLLNLGDHENAKISFEKEAEISPKDPIVYDNLMRVSLQMGKLPEALEYSEQSINLMDTSITTSKTMGDEDEALQKTYMKSRFLNQQGSIYFDLGRYDEAHDSFVKANNTYSNRLAQENMQMMEDEGLAPTEESYFQPK